MAPKRRLLPIVALFDAAGRAFRIAQGFDRHGTQERGEPVIGKAQGIPLVRRDGWDCLRRGVGWSRRDAVCRIELPELRPDRLYRRNISERQRTAVSSFRAT